MNFSFSESVTVPLWRFALISIPLLADSSREHPRSPHLLFRLFSRQASPFRQHSALVTLQSLPDPHPCSPETKDSFSETFYKFKLIFWSMKLSKQAFRSSFWQQQAHHWCTENHSCFHKWPAKRTKSHEGTWQSTSLSVVHLRFYL